MCSHRNKRPNVMLIFNEKFVAVLTSLQSQPTTSSMQSSSRTVDELRQRVDRNGYVSQVTRAVNEAISKAQQSSISNI